MTDPSLQQAFDVLAGLFEDEPDLAVCVKDRTFCVYQANAAYAAICGERDPARIVGARDDGLFSNLLSQEFAKADREVMRKGKPRTMVSLVPDARGILSWSRVCRSPIRDAAGQLVGIAVLVRGYEAARSFLEKYSGVSSAVEKMERNYRRPLRMKELADESGLSVRQYERRFRELFGITPQQYTIRLRIITACELLAGTALPVAGIAERVGFSDHSGFTRHFTRIMGMPPLKYRMQTQRRA